MIKWKTSTWLDTTANKIDKIKIALRKAHKSVFIQNHDLKKKSLKGMIIINDTAEHDQK